MRKLVIGCGYLGSRVARKWRESGSQNGDEIFALTRSSERAEAFRADGFRPIVGDVTKPETLKSLPEVETVLYAVGFDRSAGLSQREIYVEGLRNVLDQLGDRVSRFLYISSTSVYGQQRGEWIDETSPAEPTSDRGKICRDAEKLVESLGSATIFRLAGIYGPGRLLRRVEDLKAGKPISGDPDGWLNLIHVDDAVQTVLAGEQPSQAERLFLVSDDQPVRRRDYYARLAELAGVEMPPFDRSTEPRHAQGQGKRCSNRVIKEQLGVKLQFPTIFEGLPAVLATNSRD